MCLSGITPEICQTTCKFYTSTWFKAWNSILKMGKMLVKLLYLRAVHHITCEMHIYSLIILTCLIPLNLALTYVPLFIVYTLLTSFSAHAVQHFKVFNSIIAQALIIHKWQIFITYSAYIVTCILGLYSNICMAFILLAVSAFLGKPADVCWFRGLQKLTMWLQVTISSICAYFFSFEFGIPFLWTAKECPLHSILILLCCIIT